MTARQEAMERKAHELWCYAEIVGNYEFERAGEYHRFTTFETEEGAHYMVHKKNGEVVSVAKAQ